MAVDERVQSLYDALKADGADVGTPEEFNEWFFRPGDEGYRNRKYVYDTFKADGADVGKDYNEFASWLNLVPVEKSQPVTSAPNAVKQQDAAAGNTIGKLQGGAIGGAVGALAGGGYVMKDGKVVAAPTGAASTYGAMASDYKKYKGEKAAAEAAQQKAIEQAQRMAEAQNAQAAGKAAVPGGQQTVQTLPKGKMVQNQGTGQGAPQGNMGGGNNATPVVEVGVPQGGTAQQQNDPLAPLIPKWLPFTTVDALAYAPAFERGGGSVGYITPLDKSIHAAHEKGYKANKDFSKMSLEQLLAERQNLLSGKGSSGDKLQDAANLNVLDFNLAAKSLGYGSWEEMKSNIGVAHYEMYKNRVTKEYLDEYGKGGAVTGPSYNPILTHGWEKMVKFINDTQAKGENVTPEEVISYIMSDPEVANRYSAWTLAGAKASRSQTWGDRYKKGIEDVIRMLEAGRNLYATEDVNEKLTQEANREQVDILSKEVNSALNKRRDEIDKKYNDRPWIGRLGGGFGDDVLDNSRQNSYLNDPDYANYLWAGRALTDAKKIISAFDNNKLDEGLVGFFTGAGRGLAESIGDVATWDGGISDALTASRLAIAVDKFKKNQKLSASENALLEATALKLAVSAIFKEIGRGYKAGKVTGESLPFMIEMALNPISKSGSTIASGLAKYAEKYLGKYLKKVVMKLARTKVGRTAFKMLSNSKVGKAIANVAESGAAKKAVGVATRVIGDIGAAGGMAVTSGAGHSAANTLNRHTGSVQYNIGPDRRAHFGGVQGGEDWVTSTLKGIGTVTIENASEMWGQYLSPVTNFLGRYGGKVLDNLHLGKVNKWINNLSSTETAQMLRDFRKETRWDGTLAEYFEEVLGDVSNALTIGDKNFKLKDKNGNFSLHEENSVFNIDDNVDTFLGVALMSGTMGAVNIAGYRTPTYRAKQDINTMDRAGQRTFSLGKHGKDWNSISEMIRNGDDEKVKELMVNIARSSKYNEQERRAAINLAAAVYKHRGMEAGEKKTKQTPTEGAMKELYGRGYSIENVRGLSDARAAYQAAQRAASWIPPEVVQMIEDEPAYVYDWVAGNPNWSEQEKQQLFDYINTKVQLEGAEQRMKDGTLAAEKEAHNTVDLRTNKQKEDGTGGDNMVHPVTLKDGRTVFVTGGNVSADSNGKVTSDTDDIIVVDEDNNTSMINVKDIKSVDDVQNPDDLKQTASTAIREQVGEEELDADVEAGVDPDTANAIDSRVYTEAAGGDGMVHPATLKGEGGAGYIVSGRVLTTADGQIDLDNSDSDIIIVDENGEKRMIDIHEIAELGDILDPAELKQVAANEILGANTPQGIEVGGRYQVADGEGTHEIEVLRDNGNGTLEVRVDGEQHTMPLDILQQMLGIDVALSTPQTGPATPQTGPAAANQQQGPVAQSGPVATNDMAAADGLTLREKAGAYVDAYFPDVEGEEREGFIEQLVAQNDFENTINADKADGRNTEKIAAYEQRLAELEAAHRDEGIDEGGTATATQEPGEAVEPYRIDEAADPDAIADAGFSEDNLAATADYLNGKTDERGFLEALGIRPDYLDRLDNNEIIDWVNGLVLNASQFLTNKPVESGDVRVESDEVPADAGTTLTPTPQPEAADATEVEATTEPMPLLDDGNPNYAGTTPERGRQYIYDESGLDKGEADAYVSANLASAEKDLDKIKKKPPKMGTNLVKYQKDKADWESRMQEAQSNVDYWNKVRASQADYEAEQAKARKAADAKVRAQAVVEEKARQAAEVAKQQEQAERGAGAVHPAIAEKWNNAPKIEGYKDEVVLANGERVPGTYYLVESGAVTPSHNASREFEKYEGFPVDENGNTINDRDYERDKDAQNITRSIADKYDSRALQTPVIVSKDGVVLSGNGRTMAGELAASNNTDGAYIEHLKNYGRKYGFTPEQVDGMQHPRAVFVPYADMPYTTETFAKFNAQEMKGQSKTEQAVKLGKVVDDATFNQVVRAINEHETLGDFYGDTKAATEAINALRRAGAINDMQYAEMFDGDAVSGTGRQIIENMLIGKAFEGNPDVVRMLTEYKGFRQSVVTALNEISTNVALGKDYSLENELAQAVDLAYKARKAGFKENEPVSPYATQLNLFPFEDGETVADYNNAAVLLLADLLNDKHPTRLKKKLQDYNQQSAESAAGQMDIFSGSVKDKREIIKIVLNTLHNGETEETQRPEQRGPVADERGGEASLQEDGAAGQPEQGESNIQGLESYSEDELRVIVEEHVRSAIADADMDAEITGIRFIGSRTTGTARADSDLDVLVEYQGTAREDSLFNVLNDEDNRLVIDGITVDINPITPDKSGTIEEFMKRNASYKKETTVQEQIALAEQQTETSPSDAQKEAGNYKKGHVKIDGFDISIEQPKGSVRSGVDATGKAWSQKMNNTYGYIRGTEGVDGDHIDVFFSDNLDGWNGTVYVVDQVEKGGIFDEHKVMYGFNSEEDARKAYLSNYEDGWDGLGAITAVSKDEFKKWIDSSHRKTKPFAEYKNVKVEGEQAGTMRQPTGQRVVADVPSADVPAKAGTTLTGQPTAEAGTLSTARSTLEGGLDAEAMQPHTGQTADGDTILYHLGKDNEVLTDTEVALRDGLVEVLRGAGIEVVTDEAEGQRVLDAANGHVQAMGSRVNKRMAEIDALLKGREMNKLQQAIVDVFSGKKDNVPIDIERADGNRRVIMRQGNEQGAGTKHSVFGHYGTTRGVISADDILLVPEVLIKGERTEKQRGKSTIVEYRHTDENGTRFTILTESKDKGEVFNDFYSNKKASNQIPQRPNGDTPESARSNDSDANLPAKLQKVADNASVEDEKSSEALFEATKEKFGTTNDLREAGYILPDGTMLDFSGRYMVDKGSDTSHLRGRRAVDHRAIHEVGYDKDENETGFETDMSDFISRGAIRIDANAGTINISKAPTAKQARMLRMLIMLNDGDVSVDFGNGYDSEHYVEYEGTRATRVLGDIDRYFNEGIKPQGNISFFRTENGEVYGFVRNGKIYIDPRVASAETPVHEYCHLWADALKRANPEAWERLKETMLGEKDVLEHVKRLYPELEGDELLGEVFSHYSGKRGAERLRAEMEREMKNAEDVFAKARVARVFDIIRRALSRFWEMARDLFAGKNSMLNGMRAEDFADMAMNDMLRGFDPRGEEKEIALNETHYHKVTDKAELERLNNEPTVVRYRAMQMIDGKLYPPMSAEVKGELREPTEIGVWERSDERPDLVDKNGKFKLQKGKRFKENKEGQGDTPAAYNPYFHTSTSMMNDQFTAAYVRPELVVVKVEIPESELSSGYKAEKAKDAVGNIPWHSGPVNSALPKERQRTVTLSRYCKVTGVVPDAEVADAIARQLDGLDVAVPYNVVTPNVRAELEARGVKISATPSGSVTRDINGELINRGETAVANEGAVLYEPTARTTGRDIALDDRVSQREYLLSDNYVASLTGKEFAKSEIPLTEKVARFYAENYGGKVERDGVGTVLLDERSVKDSIAHGIGRNKAVAFAAVPDIIKNGAIIDRQDNWKGRGYGSVTFAAPLEIGGKGYVGIVVANEVTLSDGSHRFYLHEVALQKNLLSEEFKTGIDTGSKQGENLHEESIKTDTKADSHQGDVAKILKEIVTAKESGEKVANERGSSYRSGSGDVIRFESHAEQLSLFGVEQSNNRAVEQSKRVETVKRAQEMSDAELLKEMGRDIAEFEKLGRGDWGIQTACTDEYDRRHIKEYNAECERVRTMLDENNVSIEEAEDMLCNAIYSWRDGYATADRSKLLAQFDTLNDYYAEKTDERDNADLYQEVESEQAISEADARNTETPTQQEVAPTTQQTEPAKPKKAAFDPSAIKLRKLKSGETCHVERRYQESGGFDFTGSEIIKDDADLAYIFRNLENSAIENTFLVLIKNGKATILHTGMGSYAASVGHVGAGLLAASKLKPDHVIFVHNHPSGRLEPSVQDVAMQTRAKKMFGEGVVREAIIIDITSGEYCTFDDGPYTNTEVKKRPTEVENEIPYKTYSFSQYVFDKNYKPGTTMQITDANKAAAFISSHRLGERDKMSLIVMSRSKYVTANVFLPWATLDGVDIEKAATTIAKYIHQMGGESGIVYGSATIDRNILDPLSREIERREVHLDDFITVEGRSAQQEGVLEDEVLYEAVPRNTEQQPTEVAEDGVGYGEADDSGISDEELAGYDAGRYSFAESITQGLVDLALKNTHDQQLRLNAMREFGGNLAKLRKIMNKQKAYDKGTVDDIVRLARMVMGSGFFKDMSAYEVKRLLAAIKKGVGAEDLTPIANNVVDMLVQHQLRESKNMLHKLMQVRGRKVDARGVEVQAGLDIDGQRMMSALKDGMSLGENGLLTRINDCENRLGSEDEVIRKNAMSEYQGLMLAKEYHDNILSGEEEEIVLRNEKRQEQEKIYDFRREPVLDDDGNAIINQDGSVRTVERKTLKPQFKNNVTDENKQLRRNTEAAIERIEQSIRESRMERVTSYIDFMSDVAGDVRASRERAAEWRAEQQQRVDEIHHNANSDLEGVPVQSQVKLPEGGLLAFNSNNDIVRLLFQPLATFEKMLRFFGRKAHNGEGYLFNRFMRGWVDCSDKEWRSKRAAHEELDAKVSELFGKKAKRWSDLYKVERNKKHPGIPVEYWDNGERVQETMSQGEALSLVVWSKQKDAEAGLRRMGISEEDIETIKNNLDPKFLQLAEWVVEEFLPKRREYYNEVHERMFGAPMAAIEHYFPIVRNSRDVEKPSDITERDLGETKPSTITGNIIKRQRTAATLDVHTDFFDHLLKHLDDMENWAAWAEFNRDINTLRNYKRFKNRVLNMHSMEYGSGKDLWKAFDDACAIAAGVYHPSTKRGSGDNLAVNIAKGVTGAKIAFRFYTAAKQLLSLPAFWNGDAGLKELAKWENPVGAIIAWNWAMKNLPGFSKRWQSRQVGDVRLMDTDSDYAFWRNNMVRALRRGGMWANALVDGMTVAMGARAVYETKKKRYLRNGYSEEQAEKRAMQDAAISYNSSQQSSEDAFLSSLQLDRTWWSTLMTVFRSASMGYQRRLTTGLRNLKNRTKKGYKAESIAFMKKQMERDGVDEATAEKAAKRTYRWGGLRSMADVFVYGFVLPFFWNLGPYALYLLMGDDDDEKKDMLKDASVHSLFGPIEGLTGGNAMSEIGNTYAGYLMSDNDKSLLNALRYHDYLSMPLGSDLQQIFNEAGNDSMAAWTDAFNLLVQAGIGINPETFTDTWVAIADACDGDPQTTKEFALCFMRVMQVPQTQTDKLFIDELGMTAKDAQKLNAMEMADRFARYKKFRNAPLLNWAYSPDESQKVAEKYRKRFLDNMQERMEHMDDEQLGWNFENPNDSERRKAVGKVYAKGKGVQDSAGKKPASNWKPETRRSQLKYQRLRDYNDLAEDVLLDVAIDQAKNRGDGETEKALRDAKKELTEIKRGKHTKTIDINGLGDGSADDDKTIMEELRARRKEILQEYGIIQ